MKITVTNKEQAWRKANEIFPTDYVKDETASECTGYDIYRHPTLNYYNRICDLGDRLEILTGEYGENVTNIWIEEPKMTVEEKAAQYAYPIITRQVHEMIFAVHGTKYNTDSAEHKLYKKLQGNEFYAKIAASDFVVAWCKTAGFNWGSIRISQIQHIQHGNPSNGHYCITALIQESETVFR